MNKIVIDVIDEEKLEIPSGESEFNFSKDTLINDVVFSNDFNTVWNICDGVTLDIQSVINTRGVEGIIKIISNNNSKLLFHLGIKATLDNKIELLNNVIDTLNLEQVLTILNIKKGTIYEKLANNRFNDLIFDVDADVYDEYVLKKKMDEGRY